MKKSIITLIGIIALSTTLSAQNIDAVLTQIENNNTALSALRKSTEANKIGNKTGVFMQNPEVEFSHLWGNPSNIGNRTDFSIRQSFDFPTVYGYKNQISDIKNKQSELEYEQQRKIIRFQARMICIELTYKNAFKAELSKRLNNVKQIANAYKSRFDIGDVSILEYNKSQVNLLNVTKEIEINEIERNALLSELAKLNGGTAIAFNESVFVIPAIIADFDLLYAQAERSNPVLQWIKEEITASHKQEQLNTALSLPKLHAGYMSEKIIGQHFQGVNVGVSIPLWENKNTVKHAKAKTIAIQSMEADSKLQFYNEMKALHTKAISLQSSVTDYRKNLLAYSNAELLRKALDKGEISLSEYFFEISVYYESINKLLEMELNQIKAFAELNRFL